MLEDLNELRTFQRILALGSLSAAARELGLGLAVVSKRLATLERRAGARLINRTTRSLSPTEAGAALVVHIERVLEEIDAAEAHLASGREGPNGLLRVSAPISFGRIHLAPIAADLIARHPRLNIELLLSDRIVDLTQDRIDIAVRIGPPRDSTAIMRKLADGHRILVAAPAYLDRHGRPRTPEDVEGHVWLRYGDGLLPWRLEGPAGARAELEARPRLRADNGDAVQDWAMAGCGIMLKSSVDVAAEMRAGRLERVLPDWRSAPAPIYALMPSARQLAGKARVFLDAAAARLEGL